MPKFFDSPEPVTILLVQILLFCLDEYIQAQILQPIEPMTISDVGPLVLQCVFLANN